MTGSDINEKSEWAFGCRSERQRRGVGGELGRKNNSDRKAAPPHKKSISLTTGAHVSLGAWGFGEESINQNTTE